MRALLIASLLAAASTLVPPPSVAPTFETTVMVKPSSVKGYPLIWHDPPTYTCSALVTGLGDGSESGARYAFGEVDDLVVGPGAKKTKTSHGRGYETELTVKISGTGDRADATVTMREGTRILTRQRSTVWLDRSARVGPGR